MGKNLNPDLPSTFKKWYEKGFCILCGNPEANLTSYYHENGIILFMRGRFCTEEAPEKWEEILNHLSDLGFYSVLICDKHINLKGT
jgi:hypothetical protein